MVCKFCNWFTSPVSYIVQYRYQVPTVQGLYLTSAVTDELLYRRIYTWNCRSGSSCCSCLSMRFQKKKRYERKYTSYSYTEK